MGKTPRIAIPAAVREYVYQRDRAQCQCCGKMASEAQLTVDHIVPLAKGGSNDISNLQTLCLSCNSRKKDRLDVRFRRRFSD